LLSSYCCYICSPYVLSLGFLFPICSLGDKFTPVAAYAPTGPDAPVARVYEDPVELSMKLLNKVDPFVDMVSPLCLLRVSLVLVLLEVLDVLMLALILIAGKEVSLHCHCC
jgi:hypothetical protein